MAFHLEQQLMKNSEGKIPFRILHQGGKEHYHIGVWLEGPKDELKNVERVEYLLHPTFHKRLRRSENRDNKFSITFWTWGTFEIEATIFLSDGNTQTLSLYLKYELPPDNGRNYARV